MCGPERERCKSLRRPQREWRAPCYFTIRCASCESNAWPTGGVAKPCVAFTREWSGHEQREIRLREAGWGRLVGDYLLILLYWVVKHKHNMLIKSDFSACL